MKRSFMVLHSNFRTWRKNSRVYIPFVLAFVCVLMLCQRVMTLIRGSGYSVNLFEVFICIFNDQYSILLISILIIMLMHDAPLINAFTPYILARTSIREWLVGQILYTALVTLAAIIFILISSVISGIDISYTDNEWSNFVRVLNYLPAESSINMDSFVKVMDFNTPLSAVLRMSFLIYMYFLILALVILDFNLSSNRRGGVYAGIIFSAIGFLLTPSTLAALFGSGEKKMYVVNIVAGWISPLNHATLNSHSFGYDGLPTVMGSMILFICLGAILSVSAFWNIRRYQFDFSDRRD